MNSDLVLRAMALAERVHRGHERKAPENEYRPAYFLHLAEVGWMLQEAGMDDEVVASSLASECHNTCKLDLPPSAIDPVNCSWIFYASARRGLIRNALIARSRNRITCS